MIRLPLRLISAPVSIALLSLAGAAFAAPAAAPDFSREVRPILANNCFKCHGPDDRGRKGKLRLDDSDSARKGGKSGEPAIVPGQPDQSDLILRINETNPDEVMPPADSNK